MFLIFLRSSVTEGGKGKSLFLKIIKQYPWPLCWEVLKTTFRFHDWFKGLTKLRKALMLTFLVYCSERTQIKISKGKKHMRQGPGDIIYELPVLPS